ncbi:MAG: UDP-N-acetylglucosamine 1-carboxyvinyltransferase [Mycoplasmatales bacterium]
MKPYFKINGNKKLSGKVSVSGAKNSVLPLIFGTLLTNNEITLEDVPDISDVYMSVDILKYLGSNVIISNQGNRKMLSVDNKKTEYRELLIEEVTKFRASYYLLGSMIAKYGKCKLLLPGGCDLGPRPIDFHIKGFEDMGCVVELSEHDGKTIVDVTTPNGLKPTTIFLDFPSVGATINLILASIFTEGQTVIDNAAQEPEIVDLCTMLNSMGGNIKGAGTSEIRIKGVEQLGGGFHQVVPDRIEAATYLMIGGLIGENYTVENVIPEHLEALISKMEQIGIHLNVEVDKIHIVGREETLKSTRIKTGVFPSFPTDMQQIITTMLTQTSGVSEIIETIYPDRYRNCHELISMGADIEVRRSEETCRIAISGATKLSGTKVKATDLRAGMGMVFAGLIADGETHVHNIEHVIRGYDCIIDKLQKLGADIEMLYE